MNWSDQKSTFLIKPAKWGANQFVAFISSVPTERKKLQRFFLPTNRPYGTETS
jgi:hypothetical protein